MSATIITNKHAAALQSPSTGKIIYILFEETYEKNVRPYNPQWGCTAIGEYPDVLETICRHAAACEGGSLQSRSGNIKPENFIAAWQRKLAAPTHYAGRSFCISIGDDLYSGISRKRTDRAESVLKNIGREDLFIALQQGDITLSLYDDIDVILALFGINGISAPWKIFSYGEANQIPHKELGFNRANQHVDIVMPTVHRVLNDNVVALTEKPVIEWEFSIVGNFIRESAYQAEIQCTGSSKKLIAEFREKCANAKPLPPHAVFKVQRTFDGCGDYEQKCSDELAFNLGLRTGSAPVTKNYEFSFDKADRMNAIPCILKLSPEQFRLYIPEPQALTNTFPYVPGVSLMF